MGEIMTGRRVIQALVSFFVLSFLFGVAAHQADAQSFDSLRAALVRPKKVTSLALADHDARLKQLPPEIGKLTNLKSLRIGCLPNLEVLPAEIGNLSKLEKLIIDGNSGCQMSVSLPESVGKLKKLKVLKLKGPADPGSRDKGKTSRPVRPLPEGLAQLKNLAELDLTRTGLTAVPSQIASLERLEKLTLDYNSISEIPPFVARLKNLKELSLLASEVAALPEEFSAVKGLKITLGTSGPAAKDQEALKKKFPNLSVKAAADPAPVRGRPDATTVSAADYLRKPNYRVIVTSGLNESNEPVNNLKLFSMDEKTIYLYVMWYSVPRGLYHYVCKIYDGAGDLVRHTAMDFSPTDETHFTYSAYQIKKNIDKPGMWRYEIFLNDVKVIDKNLEVLLH